MPFTETYRDDWAKAAKNVQLVLDTITPIIDSYGRETGQLFAVKTGFGALSSKRETGDHQRSEPDILISYNGRIVAAIEVTGSNHVHFPCQVWIAKHKAEFAKVAGYPIAYYVFYRNWSVFLTAETLNRFGYSWPVLINGESEDYVYVMPDRTEPVSNMRAWIFGILRKVGGV
jgi:hypothetical protein